MVVLRRVLLCLMNEFSTAVEVRKRRDIGLDLLVGFKCEVYNRRGLAICFLVANDDSLRCLSY